MSSVEFCVSWDDHHKTVVNNFEKLLNDCSLVDCTIAAEGHYLKVHRLVLSACSPYFETLFKQENEKNPIVVLKDVKFEELKAVIDFMYCGTVQIPEDQLRCFIETAESLQVRGLMNCISNEPHCRTKELVCKEQRSVSQICSKCTRSCSDVDEENASVSSPLTETADGSNRCNDAIVHTVLNDSHLAPQPVLSSCNVSDIASMPVLPFCGLDEERAVPPNCLSAAESTTPEQTPELLQPEAVFLLEPELEQTDENMQSAENPDVLAETITGDIFNQEITDQSAGTAVVKEESVKEEAPDGEPQQEQRQHLQQESQQGMLEGSELTNADVNSSLIPLRTPSRSPSHSQSRPLLHNRLRSHLRPLNHCPLSRSRFFSDSPLQSSAQAHAKALFRSPSSDANFSCPENSSRSANGQAGKSRNKCRVCNMFFDTNRALRAHALAHDSRMPFGCQVCGQTFRSRKDLAKHTRRHTRERPYECDMCGETFAQLSFLVLHRHVRACKCKCATCGEVFSSPSVFEMHRLVCPPARRDAPFSEGPAASVRQGKAGIECVLCGRVFRIRKDFQRHLRLHSTRRQQ